MQTIAFHLGSLTVLDRKRVQLDDRHVPWTVDWPLLRHGMQDMKNGIPLFFNPSGWAVSAIKAVEAQFEKMTGWKIGKY